ncbi:MAG: Mrp/NBP35 family ATP-binding protein, partial [Candidatus Cloacimonetes bacterium]|nr:Mrp/NBP35 family ATP-binding protein [Candidatus Cloacimonadota bacterium]MCK9243328.1 Mrp/NBP35 family ATP-binding protein [Candidatus Cloacimonadota bacterium]
SGKGIEKLIFDHQIDLLAELELDPNIVSSADEGKPYIYFYNKLPSAEALMDMTLKVMEKIEEAEKES